ncbi:MAG: RnfABCDGE type electron transport complex subunit D [Alphaproteobacteria bacterium]|nr:RnfABCDGE type electron transport complex subunit D [Alphaproteobacteria bacterium]
MFKMSTSPHINSKQTTQTIMRDVIVALSPAIFAALCFFGINALIVLVTSVSSCVFFEYFLSRRLGLKNNTFDLSAIVTGVLLALNLPATMPIWMTILGAFMAIGVAKMAFGGIGKNIFNPALVGRVFLFISFPVQMTTWVKPHVLEFFNLDAATAATPLASLKHLTVAEQFNTDYLSLFLGNIGGSMGETSALALLIGFIWMLKRKIITWHIPVCYVGSFAVCIFISALLTGSARFDVLAHILSGGLLLGAIFMATDYTTSPMTKKGKIIFAVGCGVITYIIRVFGSYPEGVSFAILIMNAFVPLIDRYFIQYIYGTGRK